MLATLTGFSQPSLEGYQAKLKSLFPPLAFKLPQQLTQKNLLILLQKTTIKDSDLSTVVQQWEKGTDIPPAVFLKRFSPAQALDFIQQHFPILEADIKAIREQQRSWVAKIALPFVKEDSRDTQWCANFQTLMKRLILRSRLDHSLQTHALVDFKKPLQNLLAITFLKKNLQWISTETEYLNHWIETVIQLTLELKAAQPHQNNAITSFLKSLAKVFLSLSPRKSSLVLLQLILETSPQEKENPDFMFILENFLQSCKTTRLWRWKPALYKTALQSLLHFPFKNKYFSESLPLLFRLLEILLSASHSAAQTTWEKYLHFLSRTQDVDFLSPCTSLNGKQFTFVVEYLFELERPLLAKEYLLLMSKTKNLPHFEKVQQAIETLFPEKREPILVIAATASKGNIQQLCVLLTTLRELPLKTLTKLLRLTEIHRLDFDALDKLLQPGAVDQAITIADRNAFENLQRAGEVEHERLLQIIDNIRYKPMHATNDEMLHLDQRQSKQLYEDYLTVIALLREQPIAVEVDMEGNRHLLKIPHLSEKEVHKVYKALKRKLSDTSLSWERQHHYYLMIIALSCEVMLRMLKKFPRDVQLLSVLTTLNHSGNLIQEICTGEGKTLITALQAILINASGVTTEVTTDNNHLALRDLLINIKLYDYLGVPVGRTVIHPHSDFKDYVIGGINYSTAALGLFRLRQTLLGHSFPPNIAVVADEIDAALMTQVESRLAATIDSRFQDKEKWHFIDSWTLDFIQERELFLDNPCSQTDDIHNLRIYLTIKIDSLTHRRESFLTFYEHLSDSQLSETIDAALIADSLLENVDFSISEITKYKVKQGQRFLKRYLYAAPYLDSNNRATSALSRMAGVQQILHAKLNKCNQNLQRRLRFSKEPRADTILNMSSTNFFGDYSPHGRIIGLTGTAGSPALSKYFHHMHGTTTIQIPPYHRDRCEELKLQVATDQSALFDALLALILENAKTCDKAPMLIFLETAQAVNTFVASLKQQAADDFRQQEIKLQSYDSSEMEEQIEFNLVNKIGERGAVTIATLGLARGVDAITEHKQGLFVVNTIACLTPEELRQMRGRAARAGKPGKFLSYLNSQQLQKLPDQTSQERFQQIQQEEVQRRLQHKRKMEPLHEIRYYFTQKFYLPLQNTATALIQKQKGTGYSFVEQTAYLQALATFNRALEDHYQTLIEQKQDQPQDLRALLFTFAQAHYHHDMKKWFEANNVAALTITEPPVALGELAHFKQPLKGVRIGDLKLYSDFFSAVWRAQGNQTAIYTFAQIEGYLPLLDRYLGGQEPWIQVVGHFLDQEKYIDVEKLACQIDQLKNEVKTIPQALCDNYVLSSANAEKLSAFLLDYLHQTKTALMARNWQDLRFPISQLISYFPSPDGYLSQYILIPLIKKAVKAFSKNIAPQSTLPLDWVTDNIDQIASLLMNGVTAWRERGNWRQITLSKFIELLQPLLEKPSMIKLIQALVKPVSPQLSDYVALLPQLATLAQPYAHLTLSAFLSVEQLPFFLHQLSQLSGLQEVISQESLRHGLKQLKWLHKSALEIIQHLNRQQLLSLIKIIAHPRFNEFLGALPEEADFEQMKTWLRGAALLADLPGDAAAAAPPAGVRAALLQLKKHQEDPHAIAQETRVKLQKLKGIFTATRQQYAAYRQERSRKLPKRLPPQKNTLTGGSAVLLAPIEVPTKRRVVRTEPTALCPVFPTLSMLLQNPQFTQQHLKPLLLYAAESGQTQTLIQQYFELLCTGLQDPALTADQKKILPTRLLPLIHKLSEIEVKGPRASQITAVKSTAVHLLNTYQATWFLSFDRRALVKKLKNDISTAENSATVYDKILAAKKSLLHDDWKADQSFFSRIFYWFWGFRNSKGHSRCLDCLDLLENVASAALVMEGKTTEAETNIRTGYINTLHMVTERLRLAAQPTTQALAQPFETLKTHIEKTPIPQDKQHYLQATFNKDVQFQNMPLPTPVKILADSLQRSQLLYKTVNTLHYTPLKSVVADPEISILPETAPQLS